MAVRSIPAGVSSAEWLVQCNALAADFGDIALWVASGDTNLIDIAIWLNAKIDAAVIGSSYTLLNDVYFLGTNFGGGTTDLFKFNTDDKLQFKATTEVIGINITAGTISGLTTPLEIASGGTAGATASDARTALGLAIGTDVQAFDQHLADISAIAASPTQYSSIIWDTTAWVAKIPSDARTALGLAIGTDVQAWNTHLDKISTLGTGDTAFLVGTGTPTTQWSLQYPGGVRATLELVPGTHVQTQNTHLQNIADIASPVSANSFLVHSGTAWVKKTQAESQLALALRPGLEVQAYYTQLNNIGLFTSLTDKDFMIYDSASVSWTHKTPANARIDLGLVIDTDVQAHSAKLDTIAAMAGTLNNFIVGSGSSWTMKTVADVVDNVLALKIGTNTQAHSARLDDIALLTPTDSYFIVGNNATWVTETGDTARISLGAASRGANSDITSMTGCNTFSYSNTMYIGPTPIGNIQFTFNGTSRWRIDSSNYSIYPLSGNYDIGGSSFPIQNLYFNGQLDNKGTVLPWTFTNWTAPGDLTTSFDPHAVIGSLGDLTHATGQVLNTIMYYLQTIGLVN